MSDEELSPEDQLLKRQRKERKELQVCTKCAGTIDNIDYSHRQWILTHGIVPVTVLYTLIVVIQYRLRLQLKT